MAALSSAQTQSLCPALDLFTLSLNQSEDVIAVVSEAHAVATVIAHAPQVTAVIVQALGGAYVTGVLWLYVLYSSTTALESQLQFGCCSCVKPLITKNILKTLIF